LYSNSARYLSISRGDNYPDIGGLLDATKSTEFENESNDVERDSMLINNSTWKALLLLMFMIGLVLGIFVGRLI